MIVDAVMAGTWRFPDPEAIPGGADAMRPSPAPPREGGGEAGPNSGGGQVAHRTWKRMYAPFLREF